MLSVLLNILSIIGMILLIILGLIVCILLIVLFVPITYKIVGSADKQNQEVHVRINWLLGIIRFRLHYMKQLSWSLKIMWIDPMKPKNKTKSSTIKGATKEDISSVTKSDFPAQSSSEEVSVIDLSQNSSTENSTETLSRNSSQENSTEGSAQTSASDTAVSKEEKKSIKDKITNIIDKIKNIYAMIDYYIKVLQDLDTKKIIAKCFKALGSILKHIRPRKLKINGTMGFNTPDVTGKVYGYICMLYPFYGNNVCITPDFENNILEGNLYCRGRIYLSVLVWNALKILVDRKLYKLIHKLKNGGNLKNGR